MYSEPLSRKPVHSSIDRRRRQLLARIASGAGLASALSACGGGGLDDDATLRAVNATADVASIDVQFNGWLFAGAVAYGGVASSYGRRKLWDVGPRGKLEVRRAGASPMLLRDTKTLPDGDTASVVVMGNLAAGLRLRVIDEDTASPGGATARLRLLHAWPLVGAVDAFVTRADQTLSGLVPPRCVRVAQCIHRCERQRSAAHHASREDRSRAFRQFLDRSECQPGIHAGGCSSAWRHARCGGRIAAGAAGLRIDPYGRDVSAWRVAVTYLLADDIALAPGLGESGDEGPAGTCQLGRSAGGDCHALLRATGRYGANIREQKLP